MYRAFGFPEPRLHYGSASNAVSDAFWKLIRDGKLEAAAQLVPPHEAGLAAAAGLVATYLTIAVCILVARRTPHPFWVGLGLTASLRFLGSIFIVIATMLGRTRANGSDEEHVALTMHVPEPLLHLIGIAILVMTWVVLLRIPPRHAERGRRAVLTGMVVGGLLYIGVLGPWLLP